MFQTIDECVIVCWDWYKNGDTEIGTDTLTFNPSA